MGVFEALGKEADRAVTLHAEYRKLLGLLAQVARGEIAPSRLHVDLTADSWAVLPVETDVPGRMVSILRNSGG